MKCWFCFAISLLCLFSASFTLWLSSGAGSAKFVFIIPCAAVGFIYLLSAFGKVNFTHSRKYPD